MLRRGRQGATVDAGDPGGAAEVACGQDGQRGPDGSGGDPDERNCRPLECLQRDQRRSLHRCGRVGRRRAGRGVGEGLGPHVKRTNLRPEDVLSEANLDLLALLVFTSIAKAAAEQAQDRVLVLDDVVQSIDTTIRTRLLEYLASHLADWQLVMIRKPRDTPLGLYVNAGRDRRWFLAGSAQVLGAA